MAAVASGALGLPGPAYAVRPFVTDDARIIAKGQFELEMWPDLKWQRRRVQPGFNVVAGTSPTEWIELLVGGGIGLDPGPRLTLPNPILQAKLLFLRADDDAVPGIALVAGVNLPVGRGSMYDDATGLFLIAPITVRLPDDLVLIHANLGFTAAVIPADREQARGRQFSIRPYWGLGFDVEVVRPEIRLIFEAYAGDPFESLGPKYAFQWGGRWIPGERLNLDLTFGTQPAVGHGAPAQGWEKWAQLGVRLLFDVYTKDKKPGDPMGAKGLFRRRRG